MNKTVITERFEDGKLVERITEEFVDAGPVVIPAAEKLPSPFIGTEPLERWSGPYWRVPYYGNVTISASLGDGLTSDSVLYNPDDHQWSYTEAQLS